MHHRRHPAPASRDPRHNARARNRSHALDPVSQLTLGASVAALSVPRPQVRRALVYGAALGTLPDLDYLLLTHVDDLARFTLHRSFSHSLFVLGAAAPLLAWLLRRMDAGLRAMPWRRWLLAVWLALVTHPLLDAFTVYGTQLWWPLQPPPASWATIFIIDPLYTLPLLCAVGFALFAGRVPTARRALAVGLCLSSAYLAWSVAAKAWATQQVRPLLAEAGLDARRVLVQPGPLNTLLWRVLVMTDTGYAEGWYWLPRPGAGIDLVHHPGDPRLRAELARLPAMQRLQWFTHGFVSVREQQGIAVATDLRMGAEPDYVFSFALARRADGTWQPLRPEQLQTEPDWRARIEEQWHRLSAPTP